MFPSESRFMSTKTSDDYINDKEDDLKAQFEILNTDRYDQLMLAAKYKREVAKEILAAGERAKAAGGDIAGDPKKDQNESAAQAEFDFNRAKVLEKQAELLEKEAKHVKHLIQAVNLDSSKTNEFPETDCEILKLGPLKFIPQPDELLDFKNDETMGQITGNAFTVHYRKQLKSTFFWQGIELPIKSIEDSPNCFSFKYRGTDQVLCAPSKLAKDSWIDAATEGWFCRNMGIKGTLPSVKAAKKEVSKKEFLNIPPATQATKKKKEALVNVDVQMDKQKKIHVKVNGKEQPIGKHIKINAAERGTSKSIQQTMEESAKNIATTIKEKTQKLASGVTGSETEDEEENEESEDL